MNELEIAELRVVHESPVHGPTLVEELNRLRARETDLLKSWAADDHEARMMHFALHDIEVAAKAEGRPALAHLAQEARFSTANRKNAVMLLIAAAEAVVEEEAPSNCPCDGTHEICLLGIRLKPFRGSR